MLTLEDISWLAWLGVSECLIYGKDDPHWPFTDQTVRQRLAPYPEIANAVKRAPHYHDCPTCEAQSGLPCTTLKHPRKYRSRPHAARRPEAALYSLVRDIIDTAILSRCPPHGELKRTY